MSAFELGKPDAVGGVTNIEVERGPDQREAAGLAGEASDDPGAALDLADRALEQVRRAPAWVTRVHDQCVEIVGQAARRAGRSWMSMGTATRPSTVFGGGARSKFAAVSGPSH